MKNVTERPIVSEYQDPVDFVQEMLNFRKGTEKDFSVMRSTQTLRKISPALVSLILKRKRRITLDRVDELAKLLNLSASEKFFFRNWIENSEAPKEFIEKVPGPSRRKEAGQGLLNDWLNVYVKDLFQLKNIQKNPTLVFDKLAHVAGRVRVEKSLQFLMREGYLRKTLDGNVVIETNLSVADRKVPSKKVRSFHKAALKLAKLAIDLFPPEERLATTVSIALSEKRYAELIGLIEEFSEKLKEFAERDQDPNDPATQLYQLIVNLSPTGGKNK